jgi:hypothetical protein
MKLLAHLLLFEKFQSAASEASRVLTHFLAHTQLQQLPKLLGYHACHFHQAPKLTAREKY